MSETIKVVLPVFLTISIPSLMVLVGILMNKSEIARLDMKMDRQNDKLEAKIDKLDAKLDKLTELVHQGILNLTVRAGEHDTRITVLEERAQT